MWRRVPIGSQYVPQKAPHSKPTPSTDRAKSHKPTRSTLLPRRFLILPDQPPLFSIQWWLIKFRKSGPLVVFAYPIENIFYFKCLFVWTWNALTTRLTLTVKICPRVFDCPEKEHHSTNNKKKRVTEVSLVLEHMVKVGTQRLQFGLNLTNNFNNALKCASYYCW